MTILLIDDSASVREVLRLALESEGYRVIEAADGREGVRLCRTGHSEGTGWQVNTPVVDPRIPRRTYLAERILACYADEVSGREVLAEVDETDFRDPVLEELLDLFEHQPAKSRIWGLSGAAYDNYVDRIRTLASAILADPTRVPQDEIRYDTSPHESGFSCGLLIMVFIVAVMVGRAACR